MSETGPIQQHPSDAGVGRCPPMPEMSPLVRLIAGFADTNQKSWALKRPATIIGSRRPAHIVVHHHAVSEAHCAVVNTGRDVLLVDLHTPDGTQLNGRAVDYAALHHRDVITVGDTELTVEVQRCGPRPRSSREARKTIAGGRDETVATFNPLELRDEASGRTWVLERAAAMIGRRAGADIHLDADQVSDAHALLFFCDQTWMVFDLGTRVGVVLNRWPVRLAPLHDGDACRIGPVTLIAGCADLERPGQPSVSPPGATGSGTAKMIFANPGIRAVRATVRSTLAGKPPAPPVRECDTATRSVPPCRTTPCHTTPAPRPSPPRRDDMSSAPGEGATAVSAVLDNDAEQAPGAAEGVEHTQVPAELDPKFAAIKTDLDHAWARLNKWKLETDHRQDALPQRQGDLARRIAELDARDAALRGLLHDLSRYHEQLVECQAQLTDLLGGGEQISSLPYPPDQLQQEP